MTIYQKVLSVFGLLRTLIGMRAAREELAHPFDSTRTYNPGRLVVYSNTLYRCIAKHIGVWNESHFTATTVDDAIVEHVDPKNYVKKEDLTNYINKDDVVPVEVSDGVKIATIGGKDIKIPPGGGGGGAEYGYPIVNVTPETVGGLLEAHVADYTISTITVTDSTPIKIVLPANTTGRSLHLIVRIVVDMLDNPPSIVFVPPTDDIGFESADADWMTLELGINMFTFIGVTNG